MTNNQQKQLIISLIGEENAAKLNMEEISQLCEYSPAQIISKATKLIAKKASDEAAAQARALKEQSRKAQQDLLDAYKARKEANVAKSKQDEAAANAVKLAKAKDRHEKTLDLVETVNSDYISVLKFESVAGLEEIGKHTIVDSLGDCEVLGTFIGKYTDKYITVQLPVACKNFDDPKAFLDAVKSMDRTLLRAVGSIQETSKTEKGFEIKSLFAVMQSLYKFDATSNANDDDFTIMWNKFFSDIDVTTVYDMLDLDRIIKFAIKSTDKFMKALGVMGDNPTFFATDDTVIAVSVHAVGKFFSTLRKEYMGAFRNVAYMLYSMGANTLYNPNEEKGNKNE
jgi:hypothetical protein